MVVSSELALATFAVAGVWHALSNEVDELPGLEQSLCLRAAADTLAVDEHARYRSDFGHRLECVLDAFSVCTQINVDYLDGHLEHREDILRHLAVRTVRLGKHDHTVLADQSSNERLWSLRPTERCQRRSHSDDI